MITFFFFFWRVFYNFIYYRSPKEAFIWSLKLNKMYQTSWVQYRDKIFNLQIELVSWNRIFGLKIELLSRDRILNLQIEYYLETEYSICRSNYILRSNIRSVDRIRGESHIDFRTQCVMMYNMTPHSPLYAQFPVFRQNR